GSVPARRSGATGGGEARKVVRPIRARSAGRDVRQGAVVERQEPRVDPQVTAVGRLDAAQVGVADILLAKGGMELPEQPALREGRRGHTGGCREVAGSAGGQGAHALAYGVQPVFRGAHLPADLGPLVGAELQFGDRDAYREQSAHGGGDSPPGRGRLGPPRSRGG